MEWIVEKVINFSKEKMWDDGFAHLGFHDYFGNQYVLDYENNWVGCYGKGRVLLWTAGEIQVDKKVYHMYLDIQKPVFLSGNNAKDIIISSSGNKLVYKISLNTMEAEVLLDCNELEMKDVGNCIFDQGGNIWINEITGCRIWQFNSKGEVIRCIGNGDIGFQKEDTCLKEARFDWIYDMKCASDGRVFVLDSKNFSVRMIDLNDEKVKLVVGTGISGYSGDSGLAVNAKLGGDHDSYFNGPWSLAVDEMGNIFIGDTQNHVVRMVDHKTKIITTIAGKKDVISGTRNKLVSDPLDLNLPLICSMDYYNGKLYIPEWDGDLVILKNR